MPKIHLLPPQVSELIAAGEVVERPSSVVKELLENAIDAKATAITVELKEGGIRYLRVTDNGVGIVGEDVPTAFLRHATSKLQKRQDLEQIATLGFRGEALASIAAVAKVELLTKTLEEKLGARATVQGGGRVHTEAVGCPEGTTVVVRDLFYNLPARLKFLKKTATEAAYVVDVVEKLALSHPEISFRLIKDNKSLLHTPGDGKLLSAVYTVLGREFAAQMREVDYTYNNIRLTGLVTRPSYTRANRKLQLFFVNQRYVRSGLCMQALQEAYKNEIMIGRFPACVLELTLPYASVDVNVHPAKTEIKFLQDSSVYECIYFGVKSALSAADELTTPLEKKPLPTHPPISTGVQQTLKSPKATAVSQDEAVSKASPFGETPKPEKTPAASAPVQPERWQRSPSVGLHCPSPYLTSKSKLKQPSKPAPASSDDRLKQAVQGFSFLSGANFSAPKETPLPKPQPAPVAPKPHQTEEAPPLRYLGEVFQTYLLLEAGDKLIVMDKHAAHERIRYEQLRSQLSLDCAQALVHPVPLTLTADQQALVEENRSRLAEYGLRFGRTEEGICLTAAPSVLEHSQLSLLVEEMLSSIAAGKQDISPAAWERLLETTACRGAIKGGEENSREELERLALQVWKDPTIRHCPHGRPVAVVLTRRQLEKRFGRTGSQALLGEEEPFGG